ncbi:MAG TPA: HAMP domain-containing sensor histidine kinase [Candidatus Saccharimonadales bacterium]|nr:HAMP domain-containing sensor histidine kinase [Candidatus Saccharimonadales bacterium]
MFHSAAIKITAWYLGIILLVSIVFSVALYNVSSNDLDHNINRQVSYYNGFLSPFDLNNYSQLRQQQLDQDRDHLKANLIILNVFVLIFGGAASYALARRTLQPIEESLESQKRFAADASHELRTPLTAMQSEIEVALRDPKLSKVEAVALLGSNLEEVAKLRDLSEGLLKLANRDGKAKLDQAVSLKDIASLAIDRVEKSAQTKKMKIINDSKDVAARGDQQYLADLAAVLIDNAIKYSPERSEITISTGRRNKMAFFRVQDHGIGIAAADLPHIFERFYRADTSRTKNKSEGYGLGLALAKKIADMHQGHIEVRSSLGKGSTFTVYLPSA